MTKILLVGEYYSDNLGDPLLCRTVENILKKEFKGVEIIPLDMSGKVSMTEWHIIKKRSRAQKILMKTSQRFDKLYSLFAEYRVLKTCWDRAMKVWAQLDEVMTSNPIDLVVFAGGELFMDYFAGIINLIIKKVGKTKIIFHACGMHELSRDSIYVLKRALKSESVCSISLRDSYERFCETFDVRYKTSETCDTALLCSEYFEPSKENCVDYGIGIINNDKSLQFQKELINYFITSGKKWKVFTNGSKGDVEFAKKLLVNMGISFNELEDYLEKRPHTAGELVKDVTKFKYIISFRMHSQVIAQAFGIPSFGIVWDNKIVEFYNKLNLNNSYSFLKDALNMSHIFEKLDKNPAVLRKMALEKGKQSEECLINAVQSALMQNI